MWKAFGLKGVAHYLTTSLHGETSWTPTRKFDYTYMWHPVVQCSHIFVMDPHPLTRHLLGEERTPIKSVKHVMRSRLITQFSDYPEDWALWPRTSHLISELSIKVFCYILAMQNGHRRSNTEGFVTELYNRIDLNILLCSLATEETGGI